MNEENKIEIKLQQNDNKEVIDEMSDEEKIDFVAKKILDKYLYAFEILAKL